MVFFEHLLITSTLIVFEQSNKYDEYSWKYVFCSRKLQILSIIKVIRYFVTFSYITSDLSSHRHQIVVWSLVKFFQAYKIIHGHDIDKFDSRISLQIGEGCTVHYESHVRFPTIRRRVKRIQLFPISCYGEQLDHSLSTIHVYTHT